MRMVEIKHEIIAQQPGDEIELIMTDSSFPNGQETRTFITQQSRKISQNSSNSGSAGNNGEKITRPGSRSPDNNDTQEWVSLYCLTV